MCHQAKNIERFGVANPTKKERHNLCNKIGTSDDENTSSSYDYSANSADSANRSRKRRKEQVNLYCSSYQ